MSVQIASSPFPIWAINRFFCLQGESSLYFLRLNWEAKHTLFSITAVIFIDPMGLPSAVTHPWQFFWTVSTELGQISQYKCMQCFQYRKHCSVKVRALLQCTFPGQRAKLCGKLKGGPGKVWSRTFYHKVLCPITFWVPYILYFVLLPKGAVCPICFSVYIVLSIVNCICLLLFFLLFLINIL